MANNNNGEPSTAPRPGQWYNITLGPSFKDHQHFASKFCTLRYEFKPASIDKSQPGTLHKSKDNTVSVEFQNNQPGKPKVTFNGASEDYKDNDAVLFFDGDTFRLERLHRAVKRLRHVRLPGDSAAVSTTDLSPARKGAKVTPLSKDTLHQVPAQSQWMEVCDPESIELKNENNSDDPYSHTSWLPQPSNSSPYTKNYEYDEHVDILDGDDDATGTINAESASKKKFTGLDIDINLPHQADTDDEIADVDIVEADKGPNAAEALRAQVNAEGRRDGTSSSSSSSGSGSGSSSGTGSGSGSASSSSDSETSDGDSVVNSI